MNGCTRILSIFGCLVVALVATWARAEEARLTLHDFSLTVDAARWAPSIKFERTCVSGVREYRPKEGKICLVRVTLKPKSAGVLWLVPELFLAFAEDVHFRSRCKGLRVLKPEVRTSEPGVFSESCGDGPDRPGRAVKVSVEREQPVVIELAFTGFHPESVEFVRVFAATPIGAIPKGDSPRPMEAAINRGWTQVVAMEKDQPALSGFSQTRPTFKRDETGLVEARLLFTFNATPYGKSRRPTAKDRSKPYCYLIVSVWRPNNLPGQPNVNQRQYRIGTTTLEGYVTVFCSDAILAKELRTIFESQMAQAEGEKTSEQRAAPGSAQSVAPPPPVTAESVARAYVKELQAKPLLWPDVGEKAIRERFAKDLDDDNAPRIGLQALLTDPSPEVRADAANLLGRLRDKHAAAALIALLGDKDKTVRHHTALALGHCGNRIATEPLIETLQKDPDGLVRRCVAQAFEEMPDQRAAPALIKALKDDQDADVRQDCAGALGEIGGKKAIAALQQAILDETGRTRAECEDALDSLGCLSLPLPDEVYSDVSYDRYEELRKRKQVKREVRKEGKIYFETEELREHFFANGVRGWFTHRFWYKCEMPK